MRSIKGYLDEWRIQEYLLITFFISWLSWGILILLTNLGVISFASVLGIILFTLGGFGPTISAIMCIEGKLSWKKIREFIFSNRKGGFWYLLILGALEAVVVALSSLEINPAISSATPLIALIAIVITMLIVTFFGGGNEELGWRGTLQPLLERVIGKKVKNETLSFAVATLCTGLIWALWHGPLWFVIGSVQQSISFGWFVLECVALSFWLACLYRRTHSIFYCMILHGFSNLLMSIFVTNVNWIMCLGFILITALSVVLAQKSTPSKKTSKET